MALDTTTITGTIALPNGAPVEGRNFIDFTLTGFDTDDTEDAIVTPRTETARVSSLGVMETVDLWANQDGDRQTLYDVTLRFYDGTSIALGLIQVPQTGGPYELSDLLPIAPPAGASVSQYIAELQAAAAEAVAAADGVSAAAAAAAASAAAALVSETNAATSETNAATSETNAAASEAAASTSETNAATSETNAAASAAAALVSEGNAATSETNAATSEANAATSASNAATSETNAAASEAAALAAQTAAEAAYDDFDDRYLGPKAADPTLDNDGDPLVAGALYFNTISNQMRVYDGATWQPVAVTASDFLQVANDLSDLNDAPTARGNLGLGTIATQDADAVAITGGDIGSVTLGSYSETLVTLTGTTPDIDLSLGTVFDITTSGNTTFTISGFSATDASGFLLVITAGGTHTLGWDASFDWGVAGPPTAPASGESIAVTAFSINNGAKFRAALAWASA